jgi:serine protease Do
VSFTATAAQPLTWIKVMRGRESQDLDDRRVALRNQPATWTKRFASRTIEFREMRHYLAKAFAIRRVRKLKRRICAALIAAAAGLVIGSNMAACADPAKTAEGLTHAAAVPVPSFAPLVDKVMPAVVSVAVLEKGQTPDDDQELQSQLEEFLRRFFEQQGERGSRAIPRVRRIALGSGFIIDPAGYIVTNDHVVANARKITVLFQDNTEHQAKLIGRDPLTDLALIKVDASEPLPSVSWGDSDPTRVGDWVLAVGNPFGLGGTVSFGIVSARGRDIHSGPYGDFLQIDASLNRGNSGGPTFNLAAEVIGIVTAIYTPTGGSVGVGFAIPSSRAKPVIERLRQSGKVVRGWLGVEIQEVTPELAKALGLSNAAGALVAGVMPSGPAAKAGVKAGDVILRFDGANIQSIRDLPRVTAEVSPGHDSILELWRRGQPLSLHVTMGQMPEIGEIAVQKQQQAPSTEKTTVLGLRLAPLNTELRRQLNLPKTVKGVAVTEIADDSPFADLDLLPGDIIQAINHEPVVTPRDVVERLRKMPSGATALVLVNRRGKNRYLAFTPSPHRDRG